MVARRLPYALRPKPIHQPIHLPLYASPLPSLSNLPVGAGIGQQTSSTNRTLWPLTGGAIVWNSTLLSALTYINLGLGAFPTTFNVSLHGVYNQTGAGVTCLPGVGAAALRALNLTDGQPASVQVVAVSGDGAALYNCADITFSASAPAVDPGLCVNGTGVGGAFVMNAPQVGSAGGANSSSVKAAATSRVVPVAALVGAVGLAVALV